MQIKSEIRWSVMAAALLCSVAASPAIAQDADTLNARASNAFNQALDDGRAENYAAACEGFKDAADLYESAIYALMRSPMNTDEQRDYVKNYGNYIPN